MSNPLVPISDSYGTGATGVYGNVGNETVTIGTVTVTGFAMAILTSSTALGATETGGIIGLCRDYGIYQATKPGASIMAALKAASLIPDKMYAVSWNASTKSGTFQFGGYDTVTYPTVTWIPTGDTTRFFWSVAVTSINGVAAPAGQTLVVDTGAPDIQLPSSYGSNSAFVTGLGTNGAVCSDSTGTIICTSCTSLSQLAPLVFVFNGNTFNLPSSQYSGKPSNGTCTTLIKTTSTDPKIGIPFINNYYVIFDYSTAPGRLGFAPYAPNTTTKKKRKL